jgi:hypothetical protein
LPVNSYYTIHTELRSSTQLPVNSYYTIHTELRSSTQLPVNSYYTIHTELRPSTQLPVNSYYTIHTELRPSTQLPVNSYYTIHTELRPSTQGTPPHINWKFLQWNLYVCNSIVIWFCIISLNCFLNHSSWKLKRVRVMVFNATFNNVSVISWR